jgi:hypothetical protein
VIWWDRESEDAIGVAFVLLYRVSVLKSSAGAKTERARIVQLFLRRAWDRLVSVTPSVSKQKLDRIPALKDKR